MDQRPEHIQEWIEDLTPADLPEPYRQMAPIIGMASTVKLAELYGGTGVYFPKVASALRAARDRKICEEFNGGNYKELAQRYNLSEVWIREIIAGPTNKDQLNMFEAAGFG